ncbi:MAG: hypothetical protein FD134_2603 [Gallionellaceae bacterium]|nr:MAG: hypothetical protein FD134_2603 [Gallionellaceae bacterium]
MDMVMAAIADRRRVARHIKAGWQIIVGMGITVFVTVMPEMRGAIRCVFHRIANTHRCRIGGVQ